MDGNSGRVASSRTLLAITLEIDHLSFSSISSEPTAYYSSLKMSLKAVSGANPGSQFQSDNTSSQDR
jgi:hypothetical protein